ncbi:MAG: SGNH/GDSL hydrolase family protein, partial [Myxococcota bacterium]|nr:SGNH/GDSL hydrolase family protein [Myxococcota bacterium]
QIMAERGGGVVFAVLPHPSDLQGMGSGNYPWEPYRQVMKDTADRCGVPLVSLPEVFRSQGRPARDLFLDQMHPTALGHKIMGLALGSTLQGRGWPSRPLLAGSPEGEPTVPEDPFEGKGQWRHAEQAVGESRGRGQ